MPFNKPFGGSGSGGAGSDTTAIHNNVASEINAITEKVILANNDEFIIEDSEAANIKKKVKYSNIGSGISNVVEDTTPQLGGDLDTNDNSISLDSPSSDTSVNGIISNFVAGENLVFGDFCYFKSDGKMYKADADAASTMKVVAMAAAAINTDASGDFLILGIARNDAWNWTIGSVPGSSDIFVSTTVGGATQTAPSGAGDQIQVIGWVISADVIFFNPSNEVYEIAI